jgi:hypothetical protein
MKYFGLLKATAFLGLMSTGISASAAPVSCTWQYAGGGGGGGTSVIAEVCLNYIYNGTQIVGAQHVATRTWTFTGRFNPNSSTTQCQMSVSSGFGNSGTCVSPSFYTATSSASTTPVMSESHLLDLKIEKKSTALKLT